MHATPVKLVKVLPEVLTGDSTRKSEEVTLSAVRLRTGALVRAPADGAHKVEYLRRHSIKSLIVESLCR